MYNLKLSVFLRDLQVIRLDAPEPWGLFFIDNTTPQMQELQELHNNIMYYLAIILFSVGWILMSTIIKYKYKKVNISVYGIWVEMIWPITPALVLILIAFPSFKLLYLMDEVIDPSLVIYGEGHQWYWSYQYPDYINEVDEFGEFILYSDPMSLGSMLNPVEGPSGPSGPSAGNIPSSTSPLAPHDYGDYVIDQRYYLLKVNYNNHAYGTVSNHPFKDLDPSFLESGYKVKYESYAGRLSNNSPAKLLPAELPLLEEYVSRVGAELGSELNHYNYSNTYYHYNKVAQYRSSHNYPGWGLDKEMASLEKDWERYDNRGFNIVRKVRDFRVHESLYRRINSTYNSPLRKQFFEVD